MCRGPYCNLSLVYYRFDARGLGTTQIICVLHMVHVIHCDGGVQVWWFCEMDCVSDSRERVAPVVVPAAGRTVGQC